MQPTVTRLSGDKKRNRCKLNIRHLKIWLNISMCKSKLDCSFQFKLSQKYKLQFFFFNVTNFLFNPFGNISILTDTDIFMVVC